VRVDVLYELDDDGVQTAFGIAYVKTGTHRGRGVRYAPGDLSINACTYPDEWTEAQIAESCKSQYKRRSFPKLKIIDKDNGTYVAELYAKKR
jgi:hypothetical protein